ncbi:hypothetical protein IWX90DRAFT_252928 [Phyllosticta citrichinensis]|uniref:Uncharacterized protein n=1 Tax=Phyllosticta citrichinensis TaxID=1130410 RepID=A0ABR1XRA3_9PEZI
MRRVCLLFVSWENTKSRHCRQPVFYGAPSPFPKTPSTIPRKAQRPATCCLPLSNKESRRVFLVASKAQARSGAGEQAPPARPQHPPNRAEDKRKEKKSKTAQDINQSMRTPATTLKTAKRTINNSCATPERFELSLPKELAWIRSDEIVAGQRVNHSAKVPIGHLRRSELGVLPVVEVGANCNQYIDILQRRF